MGPLNVIDNADTLLRTPPKSVLPKTQQEIHGLKKRILYRYRNDARREKTSHSEKKCKKIKEERKQPTDTESSFHSALKDSRFIEEFEYLNKIDEGSYGVVYRARDKSTDEIVALKRLKDLNESEGFSIAAQSELNTLLKLRHPNIVAGREIAVGSRSNEIYLVLEYVPHQLKSLLRSARENHLMFSPEHIKCVMTQLLKAVEHLHDNHIIHRDLKTDNILLSQDGVLKVADFGLAREYGFPLQQYTPGVVTLWYRAPELLLLSPEYSTPIDMWSVGCIFAELVNLRPLFPGTSELDQVHRIFLGLGTPSDAVWPGYSSLPPVGNIIFDDYPPGGLRNKISQKSFSEDGLCLLQGLLTYDPARRTTAAAALEHAYFKEQPVAVEPAMFPMSIESVDSGQYSGAEMGEDRGSYYSTCLDSLENDVLIIDV
ncbi:serine/threonine-protein kinase PITSLRE-like [Spodoptera litura]|uniref:Serine/threonine-protein kinase PITSLRE-like n=1 Tax=Spodoptera litura TaxID=69820 RepID=A0A9J7EV96_SPOLT|nr:serine/threonine-protein kinase PITSLRE-like [Spodoptera litura]